MLALPVDRRSVSSVSAASDDESALKNLAESADAGEGMQAENQQIGHHELHHVGREVFREALLSFCDSSTSDMQLVVKNTFIDVLSNEEASESNRSAQTCTARLSNEAPRMFPETPSGTSELQETKCLQPVTVPLQAASPEMLPIRKASIDDDVSVPKYIVKNTFIDMSDETSGAPMRSTMSCTARLGGADGPRSMFPEEAPALQRLDSVTESPVSTSVTTKMSAAESPASNSVDHPVDRLRLPSDSSVSAMPRSPPPAYPAPEVTDSNGLPAPPQHAPSSGTPEPVVAPVGNDQPKGNFARPFVVKNTFLELADECNDLNERSAGAQTCTARVGSAPSMFPPTPLGTQAQPTEKCTATGKSTDAALLESTPPETTELETPSEPSERADAAAPALASMGSAPHGTFKPDGTPACLPCAWLYKDSGCLNGANCRYCHLCPQGELKHRKKQKIARMRGGSETAQHHVEQP